MKRHYVIIVSLNALSLALMCGAVALADYPDDRSESTANGKQPYDYSLPFLEDWSSGSFTENGWEVSSNDWIVSPDTGNPYPSALFNPANQLTDYSEYLESEQITAEGMTEGKIFLAYDICLQSVNPTGQEAFQVQVWNDDLEDYQTIRIYSNQQGSFAWFRDTLNIKAYAMNHVFRVRFLALGDNSADINYWGIDNIDIYRECPFNGIFETSLINDSCISIDWIPPPPGTAEWIQWDDGVNYSSFGTPDPEGFDVAVRWEPAQLVYYEGTELTQVAFFAGENGESYSIKVWTGEGASNLVLQQPVANPIIGSWNYVTLDTPVPIDVSQELWIGYHASSVNGNPAGYDDGPAIDGYGNMIYLVGSWQTLLDYDPLLNVNWNLQGYVQSMNRELIDITCFVFKDDELIGTYTQINPMPNPYCVDEEGEYCFYLNAVFESETDYCESGLELIGCEQIIFNFQDENQKDNCSIFPNPAGERMTIQSELPVYLIKLVSTAGTVLLSVSPENEEVSLDLSLFPAGIYILILQSEKIFLTKKIILLK